MSIYKSICKIIGIKPNMTEVFENVKNSKHRYLNTLKNIEIILRNEGLFSQANVIDNLTQNLIAEDYQIFINDINSVDMWGGSGAVWEVHFENKTLQRKFNIEMIELINLMKITKVLGSGIEPLKKLFKEEL